MNNPTINDFIIKRDDILTEGHIRFMKDLVDDHKSFHYDYGGTRDKPLDGKIWQPRSDPSRKDSQFVLDPFWDKLCEEINVELYNKLLIPYVRDFSIGLNLKESYLNGSITIQKTEVGGGYHAWHSENSNWTVRNRLHKE